MIKLLRYSLYLFILFISLPLDGNAGRTPDLRKLGYAWEEYDSSLFYQFQSIDDILSYADSSLGKNTRRTLEYSELLTAVICKRFYHRYSYYSVYDNWIAWLAGALIWNHLHAIVIPDDMMKHPMAACSQQAIVLKECLKRIGVNYREVDLKGHFVLEAQIEGEWLFFDPNLEPRFLNGRKSLENLILTKQLYLIYKGRLSPQAVDTVFAQPLYRPTNAPIAPNATLFQQITGFLSFSLPLMLPLGLLIFLVAKMRTKKGKVQEGGRFVDESVEEFEVLRS